MTRIFRVLSLSLSLSLFFSFVAYYFLALESEQTSLPSISTETRLPISRAIPSKRLFPDQKRGAEISS